ncbi:hypothetical protein N7478_013147 [Penicillium angulare]|uniref:uncharacterized protein n=1 Tax=Penicillium angulare TaxID=116970 RepID=UPI0025405720|nr:uncharacterized protein N7478_013147 [Penicillium angulare]KAJ5257043.1 hypothetical protein N7478_013147 [Penicillium angulare]
MDPHYLRDPSPNQQSLSPGQDAKTLKTATPDEADTQDTPQPAVPSWIKDELSFAEQRARQLHLAIWRRNLKVVAGFLEGRVDPSKKPPFSRDLLFVAAQRADASMVKLLLDNGKNIDIHQLDADNNALAVACFHGKLPIVKLLIDRGADVDLQYTAGSWGSALAAAIFQRNTDTIQFLLDSGADPDLPLLTGRYGNALTIAVVVGDLKIVEALLAVEADVNMVLQYGEHGSALAAACSCENEAMVKLLLQKGANPDEPLCDPSGYLFPLLIAAHQGNVPIYTLLLSYGATSTSFASFLLSRHVSDTEEDPRSYQSLEKIGIKTAELIPNYSEVEFTCELSFMALPASDIRSWLSNIVMLARKQDSVQLTTVKDYLTVPDSLVLDMIVKVLENKKHLYGQYIYLYPLHSQC